MANSLKQHRSANLFTAARLDQVGIIASGLCALHCLLMPLVIGLLPLIGLSSLADEPTEWALMCLAIALGLWRLLPSFWNHRRWQPLLLLALGAGMFLIARLWWEEMRLLETFGVVLGGMLLATAHALNMRYCRACRLLPRIST